MEWYETKNETVKKALKGENWVWYFQTRITINRFQKTKNLFQFYFCEYDNTN